MLILFRVRNSYKFFYLNLRFENVLQVSSLVIPYITFIEKNAYLPESQLKFLWAFEVQILKHWILIRFLLLYSSHCDTKCIYLTLSMCKK